MATGSSLDKQVILKGETDKLEFYGDSNSKLALPARYAVGVVDHATGKIRLAEASVIQMTQTIKALKSALTDSQLEQRVVRFFQEFSSLDSYLLVELGSKEFG